MCKAFYYKNFDFDPLSGVLKLSYQLDEKYSFCEEITFEGAPFQLDENKQQALNEIFFLTHIAFGISYYKTFCPPKIIIESGTLTEQEAYFFNIFYLNGLGEFAVRNNLNLQGKINFPFKQNFKRKSFSIDFKERFLVPIGGGKDSCVTLSILKKLNKKTTPISIGNPRPILECKEKSGEPYITCYRKIDKNLIELNQKEGVYNGHVPITGMLAFILWASAVLYDYKYISMSSESSANEANLMQGKLAINHQYSKSYAFEQDFHALTQCITPNFLYFSLLRCFSELKIAELFAKLASPYFDIFTSCNKAFKLDETKRLDRWCGTCDKCRFVFLILAPFMDKETLIKAVGTNPLNDLENLTGYEELLGLSGHKPFECVGEISESRTAFHLLLKKPEYKNDSVILKLKDKVPAPNKNAFELNPNHLIPMEIYNEISRLSI